MSGHPLRGVCARAVLILGTVLVSNPARAWIFHEHREIAETAIAQLPEASRVRLNQLWDVAQFSRSQRFCSQPSESAEVPENAGVVCVDLAMLSALGGDHSCSPQDLEDQVLHSDWVSKVVRFNAELKQDLKKASSRDATLDALNASNVTLLRYDEKYLVRAANNHSHFLLEAAPVSKKETLEDYLTKSTQTAASLNSVGVYTQNHLAALQFAQRGMMREALLTEAFALHFLEDSFAAGHYAGTWGDAAERKGTHDYYCENGLVSQTWNGQRYSGHGDAFMTREDIDHASRSVRESLQQVLMASASPVKANYESKLFSWNVCSQKDFAGVYPPDVPDRQKVIPILAELPIPSEGKEGVSVPRFRIETGPFGSIVTGARFGGGLNGFADGDSDPHSVQRFELLGRLGFGTNGVLSSRSDGETFLEFGFISDSSQYSGIQLENRGGQRFGIRVPFWILPGDFLILEPFFYLTKNRVAFENVAISASNGGALGLEQKVGTPLGTLQLIAGRQFGVTLFGYLWNSAPRIVNPDGTTLGNYRSVELDFPLVELKPVHSFSSKLAFDYSAQFGYSLEIPTSVQYGSSAVNPPSLNNSSILYLRFILEAIQYW